MLTTGDRVRQRRKALNMKQYELAAACGISSAALCQIERDQRGMSMGVARKLAEKLQCKIDDLYEG